MVNTMRIRVKLFVLNPMVDNDPVERVVRKKSLSVSSTQDSIDDLRWWLSRPVRERLEEVEAGPHRVGPIPTQKLLILRVSPAKVLLVRDLLTRSVIKTLGSVLVTMVVSGCTTFTSRDNHDIAQLERNILLWNAFASEDPELPGIPPATAFDFPELEPLVREINSLFNLAFRIMTGTYSTFERAGFGSGDAVSISDPETPVFRSLVRVSLDRGNETEDPFVYGVLLNASGWVFTVKHPFEPRNASITDVYLSTKDGVGRNPLVYRNIDTNSNIMIARFDVSGDTEPGTILDQTVPLLALSPHFSYPDAGDLVWAGTADPPVQLTVLETGRTLSLGEGRVYEDNIVTNTRDELNELKSGTPLFGRDRTIHGLYYHRSTDGTTGGFAALSDIPRQVGRIILGLLVQGQSERGLP